jgi:hypothetical protein
MSEINIDNPKEASRAQLVTVANAIEAAQYEKPIDAMAVLREQTEKDSS